MGKAFSSAGSETAYKPKLADVYVSSYDVGGSSSREEPVAFDFKAETGEQKIAMLLPAVQAAREAPADSFDFTAADENQEVGLLLPAVQAAPDAKENALGFGVEVEEQQVALLLPAVQAPREAASDPLPTETFTLNYEKIEFAPVDDGFVWM